MEYIDTSVLIAFIDKNDGKHYIAETLLKKYNNKIITKLNLIEMKSVLSRINLKTEEMEALIDYLLIKGEIKVVEVDMNKSIIKGNDMVKQIKLKTLDLLHIANAVILNATKFVTFDKDFINKKDGIDSYKIEIINPL